MKLQLDSVIAGNAPWNDLVTALPKYDIVRPVRRLGYVEGLPVVTDPGILLGELS